MARKTPDKRLHALTLAALAGMLGASLIAAAPARADHGDGPRFSFFFGLPVPPPPPPVVAYGPPPIYYYEPAPRVVIQHRPYYRDWHYRERHHPSYEWRHHRHRGRPHRHHHHD